MCVCGGGGGGWVSHSSSYRSVILHTPCEVNNPRKRNANVVFKHLTSPYRRYRVVVWVGCNSLPRFFLQMINILKVHKHEIILNFFLTQIKSLYGLRKFSKKISLLFLRFSPDFRCSNISAVTEHTRNQIFFERYPKNFFFQNLHFGPIRYAPGRFFKILIFYRWNLHFN